MLFGEVVGFTELAERLDVEVVKALLSGFFSRAETEIERRGGTIENFVGDEVIALFGVPTVREDTHYVRCGGRFRCAHSTGESRCGSG